jgi:hypothetical protein
MWQLVRLIARPRVIHIVPVNDLRPHNDRGDSCWCQPFCEVDLDGIFVMLIHHSADGRELVEQHGVN